VSHLMSLVAVCSNDGLLGARDALFSCIQEALQLIQGESADGQDLPQRPFFIIIDRFSGHLAIRPQIEASHECILECP